jgi:hypothetical protein
MQERASIFDSSTDFDVSGFAPQKAKPSAPPEKVRQVSEGASFTSREPAEPKPSKTSRREPRRYRTGRNTQFNIKADPVIIEEFYKIADAQGWVLGETLERAVTALSSQIAGSRGQE